MSEEVDAGRLSLEVVVDASGLRRDIQAKVEAASRDLKIKVRAELDAKDLAAKAKAAAREASDKASVRVKAEFDGAQVRAALTKALREASGKTVKAKVEFDAAEARASFQRAMEEATSGGKAPKVTVTVSADTTRMRTEIDAARKEQEARPVKLKTKVDADTSSLDAAGKAITSFGSNLMSVSQVAGIASGLLTLAGAAANVVGGFFAMTAAASQATGVLAALPGLAAAGAQGLLTLVLGFSGISKAVQALTQAQAQSATQAKQNGIAQANSADAIRNAQQGIVNAHYQASRSIKSAEESLTGAYKSQKLARYELTKAYKAAREELQQLGFAAKDASLSESQAEIDLEHARLRMIQSRQSVTMTPLEKRQAQLDFEKAKQQLLESKDAAKDAAKANKEGQKKGITGSDTYLSAKRAEEAAALAVKHAEQALADSRRQAALSIAAANRSLVQAHRAAASMAISQAQATSALSMALSKLSPAGRVFAHFLVDTLIPRFRQLRNAVQQALLPPLQAGITAAMPLLDTLQTQLVKTASTIGNTLKKFGEMAGSSPFRKDTATIMGANNVALGHFGKSFLYIADALRHVMVVASPLVIRFSQLIERLAKSADASAKAGRESGKMAAFFDRAVKTAHKLGDIIGNFSKAMFNLGKAATPSGHTLLDSLVAATDKLEKWTANPQNQKRITDFFTNAVPVMREFGNGINQIIKFFFRLGEVTGGDSMKGLFVVLDKVTSFINWLVSIPHSGTIISTILILSGAGLGLGLVAKMIGGIVGNLGKLAKFTGLTSLFRMLTGAGKKKTALSTLGDDAAKMGTEIDKELPKDKKKSTALDLVGTSAGKGSKGMKGAAGEAGRLGLAAEQSAKKTGLLGRMLGGLGKLGGKAGGIFAGIGTALLNIPGLSGLAGKLSGAIKGAFSKIKLPSLFGGGGGAAAGAAGGSKGFFGNLLKFLDNEAMLLAGKAGKLWRSITGALTGGKLPAVGATLARVGKWAENLLGGIGTALAKVFKSPGKLIGKIAVKGAKGSGGGPLGIIGAILAGILGDWIGGGKGGARGAAGGAISGAATGAGIGGMIGALFAGVGAPIGAAIGAGLGAVIGAITGGKWWGAIGNFFTKTVPGYIGRAAARTPGIVAPLIKKAFVFWWKDVPKWLWEQIKKLPGAIVAMFSTLGALAAGLGKWAGKELKSFGKWLGRAALKTIENLPALIVDALFAIPVLVSKALIHAPSLFAWILTHWWKMEKAFLGFVVGLPGKIFHLLKFGVLHVPDLFGWITKQSQGVGRSILNALGKLWSAIWASAKKGLGKAWFEVGRNLTEILINFDKMRAEAIKKVRDMISGVVNAIRKKFGDAVHWVEVFLTDIRHLFDTAKAYVIDKAKSAFSWVYDHAKNYMGKAKSTVLTALDDIKKGFQIAVTAIGKIWSGVQAVVAGPVRWIGNNVYTKGIKAVWDLVAKQVKMPLLPDFHGFAAGGVLPGYTPGRDVHRFVSPTGGGLDLSGGEAIMVPEWTRAMGAERVGRWNKAARTGGPAAALNAMLSELGMGVEQGGFKDGGILGGLGGLLGGAMSKLTNAAKGLFADGLKVSAKWVLDPIMKAVGGAMGGTPWGSMLGRVPPMMVNDFINYLVKAIEPKIGGDSKGVVAAAKKYIGVGDDAGPNNNRFSRAFGMPGAPWCAMFVSTAIEDAKAMKHYPGGPSAAVASYVGGMKHVGLDQGRPGDLAAYRGSGHINVIESKNSGGGYMTIGGNQNALVQRGVRGGQSSILRPTFANGGILTHLVKNAAQIFQREAPNNADAHEMQTPLVRLMNAVSPDMASRITDLLVRNKLSITDRASSSLAKATVPRLMDTGGPVEPGLHLIRNATRRNEWMLTPEAVDLLGGERAVATLNASASRLRKPAASALRPAAPAAPGAAGSPTGTVNVFPQPGQSEQEIGEVAARRLGAMFK